MAECIIAPRGLSRTEAANYVGIGTTKFDQLVRDGRLPKAIQIDGRVVWDRHKLDDAFDRLAGIDDNPWDDCLVS